MTLNSEQTLKPKIEKSKNYEPDKRRIIELDKDLVSNIDNIEKRVEGQISQYLQESDRKKKKKLLKEIKKGEVEVRIGDDEKYLWLGYFYNKKKNKLNLSNLELIKHEKIKLNFWKKYGNCFAQLFFLLSAIVFAFVPFKDSGSVIELLGIRLLSKKTRNKVIIITVFLGISFVCGILKLLYDWSKIKSSYIRKVIISDSILYKIKRYSVQEKLDSRNSKDFIINFILSLFTPWFNILVPALYIVGSKPEGILLLGIDYTALGLLVVSSLYYLYAYMSIIGSKTEILLIVIAVFIAGAINIEMWGGLLILFSLLNFLISKDIWKLQSSKITPLEGNNNTKSNQAKVNQNVFQLRVTLTFCSLLLYFYLLLTEDTNLVISLIEFMEKEHPDKIFFTFFKGLDRLIYFAAVYVPIVQFNRKTNLITKIYHESIEWFYNLIYGEIEVKNPKFRDELKLYPKECDYPDLIGKRSIQNLNEIPDETAFIWLTDLSTRPHEAELLVRYPSGKDYKQAIKLEWVT